MKKVAIAAILAFAATAASAQSSVTLYGLIDAGVTYTNNQGSAHNFQATSGSVDESYFGLRGAEDIGGGSKVVFNIMNGKQDSVNSTFSRQAFVGVSNDQFGTVTVGRQYDALVDTLGPLALTGTDFGGVVAAHPFDNDNLNGTFSVNNSVKYQSVAYGGLQFEGQYGFSNSSNDRAYSVGATYSRNGLTAAAGYLQLNNSGNYINGNSINDGAVVNDAQFVSGRQQTWGAGTSYTVGNAQVGAVFTQTRISNATEINPLASNSLTLTNGDVRFNNYEVNGSYHITPAVSVSGAYTFTDARIDGVSPKYNQVTVQTDYALSKRTDVYLQGEYQRVNNTGTSDITADINGLSASSSNSQVAATVGLRHRF
jgi:GBP family porin